MTMNNIANTCSNGTNYFSGKWGGIFINNERDRVRITRRGKNHKGKFVAKEWVSCVIKPDGRIRLYLWRPSMGLRDVTYTGLPMMTMMYVVRKAGLDAHENAIYTTVKTAIRNLLKVDNNCFVEDSLINKIRESNFRLFSGENIDWRATGDIPAIVRKGLVSKNYEGACKLWFGTKNKDVIEAVKLLLQPKMHTLYSDKTVLGISSKTFALIDFACEMNKLPGWGDLELQLLLRYVPQYWVEQNVKELFKFLQYTPTKIATVVSRALRSEDLGRHLNNLASQLKQILEVNPDYQMLSSNDFNEDALTIEGEYTRIQQRQRPEYYNESLQENEWAPRLCRVCDYFSEVQCLPCAVHPNLKDDCKDYVPRY